MVVIINANTRLKNESILTNEYRDLIQHGAWMMPKQDKRCKIKKKDRQG